MLQRVDSAARPGRETLLVRVASPGTEGQPQGRVRWIRRCLARDRPPVRLKLGREAEIGFAAVDPRFSGSKGHHQGARTDGASSSDPRSSWVRSTPAFDVGSSRRGSPGSRRGSRDRRSPGESGRHPPRHRLPTARPTIRTTLQHPRAHRTRRGRSTDPRRRFDHRAQTAAPRQRCPRPRRWTRAPVVQPRFECTGIGPRRSTKNVGPGDSFGSGGPAQSQEARQASLRRDPQLQLRRGSPAPSRTITHAICSRKSGERSRSRARPTEGMTPLSHLPPRHESLNLAPWFGGLA